MKILKIKDYKGKVRVIDIQSNFQTASSSEVQPKTKMLKLNLTEVKFHY